MATNPVYKMTDKESKIYHLLLQEGTLDPDQISEKLGVQVEFIKESLESMKDKHIVDTELKTSREYYKAVPPENLHQDIMLPQDLIKECVLPETIKKPAAELYKKEFYKPEEENLPGEEEIFEEENEKDETEQKLEEGETSEEKQPNEPAPETPLTKIVEKEAEKTVKKEGDNKEEKEEKSAEQE